MRTRITHAWACLVRMAAACALMQAMVPAAVASDQPPEDMRLAVGKSIVIDFPADVAKISTSNPDIVDAVAVSTREVLLHARGLGLSTVVAWSKNGDRRFYNIAVEHNLEPIRRVLRETFPGEDIQVQAARDSLTLVGRASTQAVADRAAALAASLAKAVVNNLQVSPAAVDKQIMLRVKFAELNRSAAEAFAINLISTGAANTVGRTSTGQFSPPQVRDLTGVIPGGAAGTTSTFSLSDVLNIFAFRPDINLAVTVKALHSQGVLQILAEPNLVTTNGKEASFLVGGEFPVPVVQGGANVGAVTIQFREFGIRLSFNPALTPNGTIRMQVRPEVSTIDLTNAVSIYGFTIPALATRRIETNIELNQGQSFVIGGLVDDRVTEQLARIPALSSIPVLGALFRSRNENKTKTELIVLVSPEIIDPLNPPQPRDLPPMPKEFLAPAPAGKQGAAVKGGTAQPAANGQPRAAAGGESTSAAKLDGKQRQPQP